MLDQKEPGLLKSKSQEKVCAFIDWKQQLIEVKQEISDLSGKKEIDLEFAKFICEEFSDLEERFKIRLKETLEQLDQYSCLQTRWKKKKKKPNLKKAFLDLKSDLANGLEKKLNKVNRYLEDLRILQEIVKNYHKILILLNSNEHLLKKLFKKKLNGNNVPSCLRRFFGPQRRDYSKIKEKIEAKIKNNTQTWNSLKKCKIKLDRCKKRLIKIYEIPEDDFFSDN